LGDICLCPTSPKIHPKKIKLMIKLKLKKLKDFFMKYD
jgi:hypothetical protein